MSVNIDGNQKSQPLFKCSEKRGLALFTALVVKKLNVKYFGPDNLRRSALLKMKFKIKDLP